MNEDIINLIADYFSLEIIYDRQYLHKKIRLMVMQDYDNDSFNNFVYKYIAYKFSKKYSQKLNNIIKMNTLNTNHSVAVVPKRLYFSSGRNHSNGYLNKN